MDALNACLQCSQFGSAGAAETAAAEEAGAGPPLGCDILITPNSVSSWMYGRGGSAGARARVADAEEDDDDNDTEEKRMAVRASTGKDFTRRWLLSQSSAPISSKNV